MRGRFDRTRRMFGLMAATGLAARGAAALAADEADDWIVIKERQIGQPPVDFEFTISGHGEIGRWTVVEDPTTTDGTSIEHVSTDPQEDRFPLAVFAPQVLENAEIELRFKILSGTLQSAGIGVCLRNPESFYAILASALDHRVDLILFLNGKATRIDSAEAEVTDNAWHHLKVTINDDHFIVTIDGKKLLTTFDRTRMKDGRFALLTQEDNVTRFDRIRIRRLPASYDPK
jgi:hypothetical protein